MPAYIKAILAAALAALLCSAPTAQAEETADPGKVLASVNGTDITLGHVIAVRADLPPQYDQFPAPLLFQGILDQLIQQTLLMQSFTGEPSLQSRILIENETRAVYAGEVISELMGQGVDEAALKAAYEEQYPNDTGQTEYRASHILVKTEDEAAALIEELKNGADFATLAREKSTGPSASVGGDLGWFGEGDMVSEFFDAVTALKPGEVSPPVKTDFGWHVILLNETREKQRPDFDTVRGELENQLRQSILEAHLKKLAADAEIERADTSDVDPEAINDFSLLEK